MELRKEPKWKTVYRTTDEASARIIKLMLETEEIPVMIFNQRDSSYNAFGDIYLDVPIELVEKAKSLIESNE